MLDYAGWSSADLVLLQLALEAIDRAQACRRRVLRDGLLVAGKRGNQVHPLLRAERQAAQFAASILTRLLHREDPET